MDSGHDRMKAHLERQRIDPPRPRTKLAFYASEAASCPRLIWYSFMGTPTSRRTVKSIRTMWAGKVMHEAIQSEMSKVLGADFGLIEHKTGYTHGEVTVSCRLDGYYLPDDLIVEIKSMGWEGFAAWKQNGINGRSYFPKYVEQGHHYVESLRAEGRDPKGIWVIPANRDTGEVIYDATFPIQEGLLDPVWERLHGVLTAVREGWTPDRPYPKPGFECVQFCRYRAVCWGATGEVSGLEGGGSDPALVAAAGD
jgi:hypothetical protein